MLVKFRELSYQHNKLSLREQCRPLHEGNFQNKINIGDVVLAKNHAKTRPFWLLGRVLKLILGDDNKVQFGKVKKRDDSVQVHSVKVLYPVELSLSHAH